jgi:hypothetical protein
MGMVIGRIFVKLKARAWRLLWKEHGCGNKPVKQPKKAVF